MLSCTVLLPLNPLPAGREKTHGNKQLCSKVACGGGNRRQYVACYIIACYILPLVAPGDGTTDVTRTFHFGTPTQHEKECFTRVFKGQTFLGTAVFPNKIKGNCLDTLARKFLWDIGLDYLHGTGHGIGSYLNVHEGPMGISWRTYPNDPGLQEGMFLSNEPGYYEDGKFGIRLENIFYIVPATVPFNFKNRGFLTFRTVTLVPIQTKMLVTSLLTEKEVDYLNSYHRECREVVGTKLKELGHQEAWEWLYRETEPIG
uniref:Xaa-Pro aminopeptidase 1 n=1 Tax=Timema tahoe TaxID=61484 RepID=A0A7R9ISJ7_9NEOP|nr:unnamed protein product [Timema tahoe]